MEQPQPVCRKTITIDSPPLLAAAVSEGDQVLVTGLLAIMMLQLQEDSSPGVAPPSKHAVHQNNSQAMYCGVTFGPTFGGGHDMYTSTSTSTTAPVEFGNLGGCASLGSERLDLNEDIRWEPVIAY